MRLVSAIFDDFFPFADLQKQGQDAFDRLQVVSYADELTRDDCLIVWGGEDISPSLYNKAVGRATGADDRPSRRDNMEWRLMQRAAELGVPIIGVCRGAQMLCALAGGFLIQDCENHAIYGKHEVTTDEGVVIKVNSAHHQMLYPFEVEHTMWAAVEKPLSSYHLDVDTDIPVPSEPEFVHFPKLKGFAIQWHPEWLRADCESTQFIYKKLEEHL